MELEHYPALVTLLAHGEAGTRSLRLILWSYDLIVVVVTAAQLLQVCAHQRKVNGSSLHMRIILLEAIRKIFFSIGEGFFDG